MIDLMSIARTEHDGGDLFGLLSNLFQPSEERPAGYPEAVIWQRGNFDGQVNPIAHSLTDAYALLKILSVNKIDSTVMIAINQCMSMEVANKLYSKFKEVVQKNLNIDIFPLGTCDGSGI